MSAAKTSTQQSKANKNAMIIIRYDSQEIEDDHYYDTSLIDEKHEERLKSKDILPGPCPLPNTVNANKLQSRGNSCLDLDDMDDLNDSNTSVLSSVKSSDLQVKAKNFKDVIGSGDLFKNSFSQNYKAIQQSLASPDTNPAARLYFIGGKLGEELRKRTDV